MNMPEITSNLLQERTMTDIIRRDQNTYSNTEITVLTISRTNRDMAEKHRNGQFVPIIVRKNASPHILLSITMSVEQKQNDTTGQIIGELAVVHVPGRMMTRHQTAVRTVIMTTRIISGEIEDEETADPRVKVTLHQIIPTATVRGIRTTVRKTRPEEISDTDVSELSFRSLTGQNPGKTGGHILRTVLRTTDGQNEISWHF